MYKETCQSGRMYLFAKEADPLNGPEGSNPSVSAKKIKYRSRPVYICKWCAPDTLKQQINLLFFGKIQTWKKRHKKRRFLSFSNL